MLIDRKGQQESIDFSRVWYIFKIERCELSIHDQSFSDEVNNCFSCTDNRTEIHLVTKKIQNIVYFRCLTHHPTLHVRFQLFAQQPSSSTNTDCSRKANTCPTNLSSHHFYRLLGIYEVSHENTENTALRKDPRKSLFVLDI